MYLSANFRNTGLPWPPQQTAQSQGPMHIPPSAPSADWTAASCVGVKSKHHRPALNPEEYRHRIAASGNTYFVIFLLFPISRWLRSFMICASFWNARLISPSRSGALLAGYLAGL